MSEQENGVESIENETVTDTTEATETDGATLEGDDDADDAGSDLDAEV
jgi:hypothetical protein